MSQTVTHPHLYQDLEQRGIVRQVTDPSLAEALARGPITLYCGFDPTSDSLHVGSLLPLLTLRRFQLAGHHVIAVAGGATGMIGDPSGKSTERSLLDEAQIRHNLAGITRIMGRFLDLEGANPARVVNNADWFADVSFIGFLRDIGKHFTVNHMMAKESVRTRLEDREHGISYTEFSYMLLQAYDYLVLHERHGCALQIGASDQWGNITAGIDLIRRMRAARGEPEAEVFGLTHPLVTRPDGTKFGKTEQGTVWLDPQRTSPYQFYQFFIRTTDAQVLTLLRFFTFLPHERLDELERAVRNAPERREAQTVLAREMTRLVHGADELERVERASQALFGASIRELDARTLLEVFADAPSSEAPRSQLEAGMPLVDALVAGALVASRGAARKEIAAGGVYVNNERISDERRPLTAADLLAGGCVVLRRGKKSYHLLRFVG